MKKLNKLMVLTIAGIITCNQSTNTTPVDVKTAAVVAAHAKNLEQLMLECVQKYAPYFADLTIGNIKSKIKHIEDMRKELLVIIQNAPKQEKHKYSHLEAILMNFNIKEVFKSIQDFKEILNKLPKETSNLIKNQLQDPIVKRMII